MKTVSVGILNTSKDSYDRKKNVGKKATAVLWPFAVAFCGGIDSV